MIELPKNLKPKTKIAFFNLWNIIYALIFMGLSSNIVKLLNLSHVFNVIINMLLFVVSCVILIYEKDGRDFVVLFKDNIVHLTEPKYLIYQKKRIKDEESKKRILVEKEEAEKRSKLASELNILNIDENLIIEGRDKYFYTYLELKIRKHPRYESDVQKSNSIKDFDKLLVELERNNNGKIFTLNLPITDDEYEQSLERYKEHDEYYRLKKWQLENAKNNFDLRYYVEIRESEIDTLKITANSLMNNFKGNLNLQRVSEYDYKNIIEDRLSNTDVEINPEYIYNNKLKQYQTYLSLRDFNTLQDYYYLRNVFASQYDVMMMYRKPKDFSDSKTLNGAYAELKSNGKYNKTLTNQIKNGIHNEQLVKLVAELETNKGELFALDIIIKVVAPTLDILQERKKEIKLNLSGSMELLDNTYIQKRKLLEYNKVGVNITDRYIIPNHKLALSYPFNFVNLIQKGGLLKNVDRENLLILDYQRKSKFQKSFGFIIFGDKGSGKSTFIKEKALDDIFHYGSNVIMIDFDSETETMVNNFDGTFIDLAGVPINILRVNIDPVQMDNVEAHTVFVTECIKELYPDIDDLYLKKVITSVYAEFGITNETIYEETSYPTIYNVIETLRTHEDDKAMNVLERLEDMDRYYNYLTRYDECLELNDRLMSISFNSIKTNDKLTNMVLYYVVTLIAKRSNQNYFNIKYFPNDDNRMLKYLKYYMRMINDLDNYEEVSKLSREGIKKYFDMNKKMFSIIIDECSRTLKYPKLVAMLDRIARDDRKYLTSLCFADQSTLTLQTIEEFEQIYSLMQYKIFFDLEERNKQFLSELSFLPQEIKEITGGRYEAGEGILKIGNNTFKINSRITPEINELFEGRF